MSFAEIGSISKDFQYFKYFSDDEILKYFKYMHISEMYFFHITRFIINMKLI